MQRVIVEENSKNIAVMDVFSKLIQERIIFIDGVIDEELANGVIAQMMYLTHQDPNKVINIYINSPGGSILDGLAIYDVAKLLKTPIRTVCVGMAASMAAVLMLMGEHRCGLIHSRMMLHEASGYNVGKTKDVEVKFLLQKQLQNELFDIVKQKTNLEDIDKMFKLDRWFTAQEALECNLLTEIL
jgi:ATP-dependent Clp protease protease subunit